MNFKKLTVFVSLVIIFGSFGAISCQLVGGFPVPEEIIRRGRMLVDDVAAQVRLEGAVAPVALRRGRRHPGCCRRRRWFRWCRRRCRRDCVGWLDGAAVGDLQELNVVECDVPELGLSSGGVKFNLGKTQNTWSLIFIARIVRVVGSGLLVGNLPLNNQFSSRKSI